MPKLSLLVRVSFCFLFLFLPLENMDEWFYDRYFSIRGPQLSQTSLVLIHVDDAKVPASSQKVNWPLPLEPQPDPIQMYPVWHQHFYASLIAAIKKSGPSAIAFTSYFSATTGDEAERFPRIRSRSLGRLSTKISRTCLRPLGSRREKTTVL
ncbi:MAG: CHASE2 domain-containing protein [Bdellovibrionota bacterium]